MLPKPKLTCKWVHGRLVVKYVECAQANMLLVRTAIVHGEEVVVMVQVGEKVVYRDRDFFHCGAV